MQRSDSGFTLLEMVVAIAIFAFAMAVLYPAFGTSAIRTEGARERAFGVALAQEKLHDVLVTEGWASLPTSGTSHGWTWEVSGEVYAHDSDADDATGYLFKVTATSIPSGGIAGVPVVLNRVIYRRN